MPSQARLAGRVFGRLRVLRQAQRPAEVPAGSQGTYWVCHCDPALGGCGALCVKANNTLSRSRNPVRSCGCLAREDHGPLDLTGQPFGRLVAEYPAGNDEHGRALWHCRCTCGGTCQVTASALRAGNRTACGCTYRGPGSRS